VPRRRFPSQAAAFRAALRDFSEWSGFPHLRERLLRQIRSTAQTISAFESELYFFFFFATFFFFFFFAMQASFLNFRPRQRSQTVHPSHSLGLRTFAELDYLDPDGLSESFDLLHSLAHARSGGLVTTLNADEIFFYLDNFPLQIFIFLHGALLHVSVYGLLT
jgi:hypothetical protein